MVGVDEVSDLKFDTGNVSDLTAEPTVRGVTGEVGVGECGVNFTGVDGGVDGGVD